MKWVILSLLFFAITNQSHADTPSDAEIYQYRLSYDMVKTLLKDHPHMAKQGIADALADNPPLYTEAQKLKAWEHLEQESEKYLKQLAQNNKIKGEQFLAENAKKAGVITTNSGLQYTIIKQGTGKKPTKNSTVELHYEAWTVDGQPFDSSYGRQPFTSKLNEDLIGGFVEGLQYIKEGGVIQLYIPPHLAYGDDTPYVAPNTTFIFNIELLKVQ